MEGWWAATAVVDVVHAGQSRGSHVGDAGSLPKCEVIQVIQMTPDHTAYKVRSFG